MLTGKVCAMGGRLQYPPDGKGLVEPHQPVGWSPNLQRSWWPEQGRGRAASPPAPAATPTLGSHLAGVSLPTAVTWLLAARTSEEEGLKIITPSCFPFKRRELPLRGIFVTSRAG